MKTSSEDEDERRLHQDECLLGIGLKHLNDAKAFVEYLNDMDDIYKNIRQSNPNKKRKLLIVFDDMIADILRNKKLQTNPVVTELSIKGRELNISLVLVHNLILIFQKILLFYFVILLFHII